jgi:hypothetical protein
LLKMCFFLFFFSSLFILGKNIFEKIHPDIRLEKNNTDTRIGKKAYWHLSWLKRHTDIIRN